MIHSWRVSSHFEETRFRFSDSCKDCCSVVTVFAWEAYERGSEVHLQADPTKLELLHRSFKVKKEDFKEKQREGILEKVRLVVRMFLNFSFYVQIEQQLNFTLKASVV